MAKKDNDFIKTGFATGGDLMESMKSGGGGSGNYDEEIIFLGEGDEMMCAIVSPLDKWAVFREHYSQANSEFVLCVGDGCVFCDAGGRPSVRAMIGIYVKKRFRPARADFGAKAFEDEGHRYFKLNADTAERFKRIADRRKGRLDDNLFLISRQGGGLDTKYDIDRMDEKPTKKMLNWPGMDIVGKLQARAQTDRKKKADSVNGKPSKEESFDYDSNAPKSMKGGMRPRRKKRAG